MGGRHGDAGVDAPHVGGDDVGGAVPAGYRAPDQQHVAAQLAAALLEDLGPENYLGVAGLVLDGEKTVPACPLGCWRAIGQPATRTSSPSLA